MRIGIFTDDFLPRDSGVVSSILQLRRGLIELGHEVYIIAPQYSEYTDELPHVIRVPSIDPLVFQNVRAAVPLPKFTKRLLALRLDIVHTQTQYNLGLYGDYIARKSHCPHITTTHTSMAELQRYYPVQGMMILMLYSQLYRYYFRGNGRSIFTELDEMARSLRMDRALLKRQIWIGQNIFLNKADYVIAPSAHSLKDFIDHGLTAPSIVIPNGIATGFFKVARRSRAFLAEGKLRIATVGRLSNEKRQDVLIKAVAAVPHTYLDIIGSGPAGDRYKKLADQLGVSDRVTFHGSLDHAAIKRIFADSDVFALASHNFDTQGLVLLEAAAAGLPTVYCDKKLSESVSPKASFYCRPTALGFTELFSLILRDNHALIGMRNQAIKFAGGFDYSAYAKRTVALYQAAKRRTKKKETT